MQGVVYLLHFDRPLCPGRHTCQHYLGWALDLDARVADHRSGRGARLTQVALERGIAFEVVRTWPGDRTFERKLKHRKESPRLCPVCFPIQRRRAAIDAIQLELPLVDDPFPDPPALAMDFAEIMAMRRWRQARPLVAVALGEWDDDGLL